MRIQQIEADIMEWNEELEKKLKRRGEIWHAEKTCITSYIRRPPCS
jgi:hypothetical protein